MAYNNFTLLDVKKQFKLEIVEIETLFPKVEEHEVSEFLETLLHTNVPLAHAISTGKARSEMIIAPILIETRKILNNKISLFSGVELTIDIERGLNGICDFILSKSPEQFYISHPVLMLVGSRYDNIKSGIPQCLAEMIAAKLFHEQEGTGIEVVYGCVSTGTVWKFLKLVENTVYIDYNDYYVNDVGKILAILLSIVKPENNTPKDETPEAKTPVQKPSKR